MGAETTVYGYIRLDPSHRESNEASFAGYAFDTLYPFTNIFSGVRAGYGADIVSFAGSLKSLDEDWDQWEGRFEGLLLQLYGRTASVHLEHETDGIIKSIGYLCRDGWDSTKRLPHRSWAKWYYDKTGQVGAEVPVIRHQ
jgi:hypothetical protein